ncbi:ATP-binding protein [uncultured Microbacterium sp.]|uniref:ATP-binding protein n=1 Tax=uncultured Microbacterium sp. TaxID=191216 RepID=UPI0025EB610E|nr:ATP-binding protein [uncultured Microbacterium sp.]
MAEIFNSPFRPGYGVRPLVLGGHQPLLDRVQAIFDHGDIAGLNAMLLAGVRGSGKTSMLSEITERAETAGWITIGTIASRGFADRITSSTVPKLLNDLDNPARLRLKGVNASLARMVSVDLERIPDRKAIDTLADDLITLARVFPERGVLITIDEVSKVKTKVEEMTQFCNEIQIAISAGVKILVVFAGIVTEIDKLVTGPQLTFMQRARTEPFYLFDFDETQRVLRETAGTGGRTIHADALDYLARASQGYPYLIQLVGDEAWRHNQSSPVIDADAARAGATSMMQRIENEVLRRTIQDLSAKDREFIDALADQPDGPVKMAAIVSAMGKSSSYVEQYRLRLINSGYVIPVDKDGSLRHPDERGAGHVAFALPYLREYIRRLNEGRLPASPPMNRGQFPPPPIDLA